MSESSPTPSTSSSSKPMMPLARLLRVIPSSTHISKFPNESHLKDVCLDPTATSSLDYPESWTIGRHPLAEVTIENVNVSRKHAVVRHALEKGHRVRFDAERDRWTVSDLKSLNGVHVNGSQIGKEVEAEISHGDTVSLGPLDDYKWTFIVVGKGGRGKKRTDESGGEREMVAPVAKKAKIEVAGESGHDHEANGEIQNDTKSNGHQQKRKESVKENKTELKILESRDHVDGRVETAAEENQEKVKILEDKEHVGEKDEVNEDAEKENDSESKKGAEESKEASSGERLRDRFAAELCCPVCSEVFINPTTLVGCGHVFCSLCIAKWRKKKRSDALFSCPTCRVSIKRREIMGNIYLKNLVDSWAETLTKEQLVERQEALADRIEQERELEREEEERERAKAAAVGRGRGRRRGGAASTRGRGGGGVVAPVVLVQPSIVSAMTAASTVPATIDISSDSESEEGEDEQ